MPRLSLIMICLAALATSSFASIQLIVTDVGSNRLIRYDYSTGSYLNTFATDVSEAQETFLHNGMLYTSSRFQSAIKRYALNSGALIDTFVNTGAIAPRGFTFGPDGNLYVTIDNSSTADVRMYDGNTGAFVKVFASGNGIDAPFTVRFGPDNNLYVCNKGTNSILRFNGSTGAYMDVFASQPGLIGAVGMEFGPDQNLYVTSADTDEIFKFNGSTGSFLSKIVTAGSGGVDLPEAIAFAPNGEMFVASTGNGKILRYDSATGSFLGVFASGGDLHHPKGLTFVPEPSIMSLLVIGAASLIRRRK